MKKKSIFTIFFTMFAIGVFLIITDEYVKRGEKKAIDTYLLSIQKEFLEYSFDTRINPVSCKGFIKHKCEIDSIKIFNKNIEVTLEEVSIRISKISYNNIEVEFKINNIKHNSNINPYLSLLPAKFQYTLNLQKIDSKLGYVMLNRSLYFDFNDFDIDLNLDILLREKIFRNKNILFLLKEWFDSTTPSFYEYSLDNLKIKLASKREAQNRQNNKKISASLKLLTEDTQKTYKKDNSLYHNKLVEEYFDRLINDTYALLDGDIKTLDLSIRRKKQNIEFFNLLTNEAATKKVLEIMQVLDSINTTYEIDLNTNN